MSDERRTRTVLRRELRRAARDFADEVVALLEELGVWDETPARERAADDDAKRVRRSADTLEEVKARILADLRTRREPVGIGPVAAALGLTSRQITHPMSLLVEEGAVMRAGVRRGARYELAGKRPRKKKAARKRR